MGILRDGAFGIIRATEMAWPRDEKRKGQADDIDASEREKNIFELARTISYRAHSRRQLRRSASIF